MCFAWHAGIHGAYGSPNGSYASVLLLVFSGLAFAFTFFSVVSFSSSDPTLQFVNILGWLGLTITMCITTVLCFEQSAGSNDYITSNWKRIQHLLPPEQGMLSITQVQIDASAAYASAAILSFIEAFLCFVQAGIAIGLRLARNPLAPPPPPPLLSESKDKKQLEQLGSIMKDIQARNGKGKSKSMEALQEATQKVQDMVRLKVVMMQYVNHCYILTIAASACLLFAGFGYP